MTDQTSQSIFILEQIASGIPLKQIIHKQLLNNKLALDADFTLTGQDSPDLLRRIEILQKLPIQMNSPESVEIINRFYQAINMLIDNGTLKSKRAFALANGIEYTSFSRCEREQESDRFQLAWIAYLVKDYPINVAWIMTGEGGMFTRHG